MAIIVDYSASLITYVLVLYKFLPCLCYKSLSQYCNFSSYILKSVDQQKQVTRYYF